MSSMNSGVDDPSETELSEDENRRAMFTTHSMSYSICDMAFKCKGGRKSQPRSS